MKKKDIARRKKIKNSSDKKKDTATTEKKNSGDKKMTTKKRIQQYSDDKNFCLRMFVYTHVESFNLAKTVYRKHNFDIALIDTLFLLNLNF